MSYFKVSLAGDLGSGKSTVGAILQNVFSAEIISVGKIQRKMASELGMNTLEFNEYQNTHPEFDKILDDKLAEYEHVDGNFIFDSRMAWHFVPSAFSVYLKVGLEESAKRVMSAARKDETYSSINEAMEKLYARRACEKDRYMNFYGVDITDMNNYRLIVDTTEKTPQQVSDEIIDSWKKFYK